MNFNRTIKLICSNQFSNQFDGQFQLETLTDKSSKAEATNHKEAGVEAL